MYALWIALVCVLATACSPRYSDFFPYYDNGTKKPSLTLLPVYSETKSPIAADVPDDLTKAVRNRLKRSGKVYAPPIAQVQNELRHASLADLSRAGDLKQFMRFKGTDFVVAMDLVECKIVPYKRGTIKPLYLADVDEATAKVLQIAVRLKIVNIEGKEPKIARMELVQSNHMISEETAEKAQKGDKEVLEIIRSRLARDLFQKIEETVCVKK